MRWDPRCDLRLSLWQCQPTTTTKPASTSFASTLASGASTSDIPHRELLQATSNERQREKKKNLASSWLACKSLKDYPSISIGHFWDTQAHSPLHFATTTTTKSQRGRRETWLRTNADAVSIRSSLSEMQKVLCNDDSFPLSSQLSSASAPFATANGHTNIDIQTRINIHINICSKSPALFGERWPTVS